MEEFISKKKKKKEQEVMVRDLIKTDTSNMPEPEFKTTIRESLTTEIKDLKIRPK